MLPRAPEPFVGRQAALDRLGEGLARSPLLVVKGLVGCGKTALLLHLLNAEREHRPVRYVSLTPGAGLHPLFEALGRSPEATEGRAQALEWVRLVQPESDPAPLWVLDHAHQLGGPLLATLLRVLNAYGRTRVVVATREELPLTPLERLDVAQEKLANLEPEPACQLLSLLLERQGLAAEPALLRRAAEAVEGHPLLLKLSAAAWGEGARSPLKELLLGDLLQGISAEALELLQLLSLARIPMLHDAPGLQELATKFLVERQSTGWFVPRLIAEQLEVDQPARLHGKLFDLIMCRVPPGGGTLQEGVPRVPPGGGTSQEGVFRGELAEALHHGLAAGRDQECLALLEREAARLCAESRYDLLFAAAERLRGGSRELPGPVLLALSHALSNRGRWDESLAVLERLQAVGGYPREVLLARAGAHLNRGEWAPALEGYRQLLEDPEAGPEERQKALHYSVLLRAYRGEVAVGRALLEAHPTAAEVPLHRYRVESALCTFEGRPERALELALKALALGRQRGGARQAALSMQAAADAYCDLGRHEEARALLDEALEWGRRADEPQVIGYCGLTLGRLERARGRPLEAAAAWQDAELAFLSEGSRNGAAMARLGLMQIQQERGGFDEQAWQRCLRAARECGNPRLEHQLLELSPAPAEPAPTLCSPPAPLRVRLLGPLVVEGGQRAWGEREWPTRKSAALFASLCGAGLQGCADEVLVARLWPDSGKEQARTSLRSALHQVRQFLKEATGEEVARSLTRSRKTGTVHVECPLWLDTDALSQGLRLGTEHVLRHDLAAALPLLAQALDDYRGDYLENFREDWTDAPRQTWREQALQVCHLLSRVQLGLDRGEEAEATARRGLALDPLREELHLDLMEALLRQGRKGEALRHYKRALERLESELSLYPHSFDAIFARLVV